MGSVYERELKKLLTANRFLVVRAAGSLGVDLVAINSNVAFPIEVKASRSPRLQFSACSGRAQTQAEDLMQNCVHTGVLPLYAFRLKNTRDGVVQAWRIFKLPISANNLSGLNLMLYDVIPSVAKTPSGNYVLVWDEGLPLQDFVEICGVNPVVSSKKN